MNWLGSVIYLVATAIMVISDTFFTHLHLTVSLAIRQYLCLAILHYLIAIFVLAKYVPIFYIT